ncbi:MAG: histidine kinase dimerization/phospho-acceptor domain-containing protein, partial [Cyanobacteria bacterium J06558_2]
MDHANPNLAKTEIIKQLGFFPAFLIPAVNSSLIYRSLVQQTLFAYVNNPLPARVKEKLFIILSRYLGIKYFTICHSCTLKSLGYSAAEILELEKLRLPQSEAEIAVDLRVLNNRWHTKPNWQHDQEVEWSLLRCATLIFLHSEQTVSLSKELEELLGTVPYHYLIVLLGYIKLCHQWVLSNPGIEHQQDRRSQLYLGTLLLEETKLAQFFTGSTTTPNGSIQPKASSSDQPREQIIEEELSNRQSLEQLRYQALNSCLANAPFPVMIHTQDGEVIYLNRNWLEATGYSRTEIATLSQWNQKAQVKQREIVKLPIAKPQHLFSKYVAPAHHTPIETTATLKQIVDSLIDIAPEQIKSQVRAENQIADAIRSEVTISTRTGEKLFWELYSAALSFDWGQEELTIAIAKDITDIVKNEIKLAEVESKLRIVLAATQSGNWSWNLITNQVEVCHSARHILGLDDFDGSYSGFLQSINPDERESIDLAAARAIQAGTDLDLKYSIVKAEQEISLIHAQGRLDYDELGRPVALTGVVTNITPENISPLEQKQQVQPQSISPYLDQDLATNDILDLAATQEELTQRTLQLEAANRELESFSYSVSHDLQAPLRIINGFSQVLWDNYLPNLDDRGKHYLQRIQANSQQMSSLIDALLQLSRVTRSQMKLEQVDLSAIALEIMEELRTQYAERQVELTIAPDLQAKGDPQLLRIVLNNLLHNAWKYTSNRQLAKIEFGQHTQGGGAPTFFIRD